MLHLDQEEAAEQNGPNLNTESKRCRLVVLKYSAPGSTGDLKCVFGKLHAVLGLPCMTSTPRS